MSEVTQATKDSPKAEKPKRNPVERIIVWGVIGIGILIACTEGVTRFGYSQSLSTLQNRVHDDEAADAEPLTIEQAESLIVGFPGKEVGNMVVTYRFKGLVKEFGAIHLSHDEDGFILGLKTDAPPEEVEVVEFLDGTGEETETSEEPAGTEVSPGGEGGGSGMGGGGGRRNFDPMQFDADKDGKISLEEAPDRMKESFSESDTNGDGFIDAEEFAARRAARQQRGNADSPQGNRPQRPDVEESATDKPAEEEATSTEAAPKDE